MNNKEFKTGLIVGRFQHIHIGHEKLINMGLKLCDTLVVFVSSSDKINEQRNPFDADYRVSLINKIYEKEIKENKLKVFKLNDLTNENDLTPLWGMYVINKFEEYTNQKLECIIYGKDKDIDKCFPKDLVENITEIFVSRNQLVISATKMREYLLNNDLSNWKKYSNKNIHDEYDVLRKRLSDK